MRGNLSEGYPCKNDDAMFLPLVKAMRLRRDVCLWHVADYICYCEHLIRVLLSVGIAVDILKTHDIFNFFCLTIKKYRV